MSTVVCQGVQSRLESQLMESRTLKLNLYSHKTVVLQSVEMALQSCIAHADFSKKLDDSLQNLSSTAPETPSEKLQVPYVHSSDKRASWWLSEKSLSLCTENLGSETGSEFIENSIFSSSACSSSTSTTGTEDNKTQVQQRQLRNRRVIEPKKQFPPPLTTLSGSESLNIRPQREDGRLILNATRTTPFRRSCFQVNRSNGRLRISLASSSTNMHLSNDEDNEVLEDQKVTNKEKKYKVEKLENDSPELASCSSYDEEHISIKADRVEMTKFMDQHRRGTSASCCRCNESHKNNNANTMQKGLISLMVTLEPRFLVASS